MLGYELPRVSKTSLTKEQTYMHDIEPLHDLRDMPALSGFGSSGHAMEQALDV